MQNFKIIIFCSVWLTPAIVYYIFLEALNHVSVAVLFIISKMCLGMKTTILRTDFWSRFFQF